jgi:hypothetical protein
MSVSRGIKLFPVETGKAIALEVTALSSKDTFKAVDGTTTQQEEVNTTFYLESCRKIPTDTGFQR